MISIEILSTEVKTRKGISQKNQKPYSISEQDAYVSLPSEPYPVKITLNIKEDEFGTPKPYSPGKYKLSPDSFYVDRYLNLAITPNLIADSSSKPQPVPKSA